MHLPKGYRRLLWTVILVVGTVSSFLGQEHSKTYRETRSWLQKMETGPSNPKVKKLFETADQRMSDMIGALDDPDKNVSVSAQKIIIFLSERKGLEAIREWKIRCKQTSKPCHSPILNILPAPISLEGSDSDPVKIAYKNKGLFAGSKFNEGDITIKLIAYNERLAVALLQVVQGQSLTAGWISALRFDGRQWWLLSDNNVWVS